MASFQILKVHCVGASVLSVQELCSGWIKSVCADNPIKQSERSLFGSVGTAEVLAIKS